MQIVINMSKEEYNKIKENDCGLFNGRIYQMIRNGTPLPEVPGRLIILSEDAVKREQIPLSFSCQNWINEFGLSSATVATIKAESEEV